MRWILVLTALLSNTALAQSQLDTPALEPLSMPYLLKLTGGLLLVVVVILAFAWLVKKFNLNQQSQNGLIKIIAGLSIGTRDRIVLLQVGGGTDSGWLDPRSYRKTAYAVTTAGCAGSTACIVFFRREI
jgi:flagellar protein FliO/FliZ